MNLIATMSLFFNAQENVVNMKNIYIIYLRNFHMYRNYTLSGNTECFSSHILPSIKKLYFHGLIDPDHEIDVSRDIARQSSVKHEGDDE